MSVATTPESSTGKRRQSRSAWPGLIIFGALFALLLHNLIILRPRAIAYMEALQTLQPEVVKAVRLKGTNHVGDSRHAERQLDPEEVPGFLELISQARDRGIVGRVTALWICEVEIEVVDRPPFK